LPQRNLLRGFAMGLPNGQDVACAMDQPVLADRDILIGKAVDAPQPGMGSVVASHLVGWRHEVLSAVALPEPPV
jgi:hypothetical protein